MVRRMESLRKKYIRFFVTVINQAIDGRTPVVHFCDDVVLQLYSDGEELHWRRINGGDSSKPERDS